MFVEAEELSGGGRTQSPAAVGSGLAGALTALGERVDGLAAVDLGGECDDGLFAAAVEYERLTARLAAQQLRLLAAAQRREAYAAHGAVTLASWYRNRARLDHGDAARRGAGRDPARAVPPAGRRVGLRGGQRGARDGGDPGGGP